MLSKVRYEFDTPIKAGETLFNIAICLMVPYMIDRLILTNMRTLGTRIASNWSKARAGGIFMICLPASMVLNFLAPSDPVLRYGAAGLVALVGLYQVSRLVSPSFKKMGKNELDQRAELAEIQQLAEAAGIVAPSRTGTTPAPVVRKPDQAELDARRRAGYDKKSPTDKAMWTKNYRERIAKRLESVVPTSPGMPPVGQLVDAYQS
jgi:hypothetical protein